MLKFPRKLKGFNLFIDGIDQHACLVDVTRPKIAFKTNDYTPGGVMGVLKTHHGLEALELQFTMGGYDAAILGLIGGTISGTLVRYQGSLEDDNTGEVYEIEGEARGRINEADPGTDKQGDDSEHKFTSQLTYWRETLNGRTVLEIDLLGMKCIINGKDHWEKHRKALGL